MVTTEQDKEIVKPRIAKCERCGKPTIIPTLSGDTIEPTEIVCLMCVTDDEWEAVGVTAKKAKEIIKKSIAI